MTVDWGSAPEWLSGIGSVAALIFAGIAARAALRANSQQVSQLRKLEQVDERRVAAARRAQASSIAVWIQVEPYGDSTIFVVNGSGVPIYRLSIFCRCGPETVRTRYAVRGPTPHPINAVRATERLKIVLERQGYRTQKGWLGLLRTGELSVSASFMDSDGLWWARTRSGALICFDDQSSADSSAGLSD